MSLADGARSKFRASFYLNGGFDMIQINDQLSEILPFDEAKEKFLDAMQESAENNRSDYIALHTGTKQQLKAVKENHDIDKRLKELTKRVDSLEPVKSSTVAIPCQQEIERFGK